MTCHSDEKQKSFITFEFKNSHTTSNDCKKFMFKIKPEST